MDEPLVWAFLRHLVVHELPCPEVNLDPDGDLEFDWSDGAACVSVSLSPTGRVGWAALIGEYKSHGHFQWPEWSPELDQAFVRFNAHA